jgi:hypothetical protein
MLCCVECVRMGVCLLLVHVFSIQNSQHIMHVLYCPDFISYINLFFYLIDQSVAFKRRNKDGCSLCEHLISPCRCGQFIIRMFYYFMTDLLHYCTCFLQPHWVDNSLETILGLTLDGRKHLMSTQQGTHNYLLSYC